MKGKNHAKIIKDSYLSLMTYSSVKQEVKKLSKSRGITVSGFLEKLLIDELRKEGVSVTVKFEKKLI